MFLGHTIIFSKLLIYILVIFADLIKEKENVGKDSNPFLKTYQMEADAETYFISV